MRPVSVPGGIRVLLLSIVTASVTFATAYNLPLSDSIDSQPNAAAAPIVDLGYDRYQGYRDAQNGLNIFKGCAAETNFLRLVISIDYISQDSIRRSTRWQITLASTTVARTIEQ